MSVALFGTNANINVNHLYQRSIQHDYVDFDSFVKFAVFIQNLGYFLFRYTGWRKSHFTQKKN